MEADWSVEIGPGLPIIDAAWDGFVDLRSFASNPDQIETLAEARQHPALRDALLAFNASGSPVFTTKCDCWKLVGYKIDPDEFAASRKTALAGFASYIDLVDRNLPGFVSFELHENRARKIVSALRVLDLHQGRVDLVLRTAVLGEQSGFGITLYAAGCGATEAEAYPAWQTVLGAATTATIAAAAQSPRMGE